MEGAKKHGVYGSKPLSYYHGTNRFYDLWASTAAKDKELFHEFCRFVIGNPLRQQPAASGKPAAEQGYRTTGIQDLALIYQGGSHRLDWTVDEFRPYVVHRFADGSKDWLFDGFLFLEFKDGSGRNYTVGYEKLNARRTEWEWLLDRIFEQGKSLSALDRCIGQEIKELGKPAFRHQIVLGLPEAIRGQKDWGEIDGREMDFSKEEDQIAATKWYIGELVERFKAAKYKHLELSGFYWVAEDTHHCAELTIPLSEYIHSEGKLFYWIPYWQAKGHEEWKRLGFDVAYQQPNHFFNHSIPDSRLDEACATARRHGMAMEFEFDEKATAAIPNSSHDRMAAYINHFEKERRLQLFGRRLLLRKPRRTDPRRVGQPERQGPDGSPGPDHPGTPLPEIRHPDEEQDPRGRTPGLLAHRRLGTEFDRLAPQGRPAGRVRRGI